MNFLFETAMYYSFVLLLDVPVLVTPVLGFNFKCCVAFALVLLYSLLSRSNFGS